MAAVPMNLEDLHEPSVDEINAARTAARRLAKASGRGQSVSFVVDAQHGDNAEPITLPLNIFKSIVKMLAEMGNGNAVQVVPVKAELTTQQAADLLNVSRPHLIKLLETNEIKFRKVGTHRKVVAKDILAYRDKTTHERRSVLSSMIADDEELGLLDNSTVGDEA